MQIRALRETDDRSRFRSGDPDLDRFFHKFAGQNQFRHYVGVTYVAVDGGRVLGFPNWEGEAQARTIDRLTAEEFINTNPNVAGGRGSASNLYRRAK